MPFIDEKDIPLSLACTQENSRGRYKRYCDGSARPWYKVQICASRNHDEALRLALELRSLGYTAYVVADLDYKVLLDQQEGES